MIPENASMYEELEARLRFEKVTGRSLIKVCKPPGRQCGQGDRGRPATGLRVPRSGFALLCGRFTEREPETPILTHVYQGQGHLPIPDRPLSRDLFPWTTSRILGGEIIAISSMADLPPEASHDRENYIRYGSRSTVVFPLSIGGGTVFGLLTFATTHEERTWHQEPVQRLQLVAQIFANALARKWSDELLRESEARLGLAADSADAGLWSLDISSGVFWVTQRTRQLFGYTPDEVVTLEGFLELVHPSDRELVQGNVAAVVQSGNDIGIDYRIIRRDGVLRWISSSGLLRSNEDGEPDRLMGISIDITNRKQAKRLLES